MYKEIKKRKSIKDVEIQIDNINYCGENYKKSNNRKGIDLIYSYAGFISDMKHKRVITYYKKRK